MYKNNRGPTDKNIQLQKHQAKVTEKEIQLFGLTKYVKQATGLL